MWDTGTQYDVSVRCFRFGKIPFPTNSYACSKILNVF